MWEDTIPNVGTNYRAHPKLTPLRNGKIELQPCWNLFLQPHSEMLYFHGLLKPALDTSRATRPRNAKATGQANTLVSRAACSVPRVLVVNYRYTRCGILNFDLIYNILCMYILSRWTQLSIIESWLLTLYGIYIYSNFGISTTLTVSSHREPDATQKYIHFFIPQQPHKEWLMTIFY